MSIYNTPHRGIRVRVFYIFSGDLWQYSNKYTNIISNKGKPGGKTCTFNIRTMPRIHIRTSRIGLLKLAISRRYYKIFSELFSKKSTSHSPSGISSRSKKLLQVILYLSAFSKKVRTRNIFLRFLRVFGLCRALPSRNLPKHSFSF